ncbi:hypothetical protein [Moheibacter stercoris]|uniref:Uncharacterized protein n=1 Tax=Moheibacter stercoris TaxID=1628251 RepID=A0ABV2LRZ5_9FLAO
MKKYLFLILVFTLQQFPLAFGQNKDPEHYQYPLEEYYKPLEVQLNIVLLYRSDGKGNYDLKDPEQKKIMDDYLDQLNYLYANFILPDNLEGCYNNTDFLKHSKIQFKPNVLQVKNTYAWDYMNSGADPDNKKFGGFSPTEKWYIKSLDDSISSAPNIPKGINVYFTTNGQRFDEIERAKGKNFDLTGSAAAEFPTERNLKRSSQAHIPNRYLKYLFQKYESPRDYNTTWEETRNWHVGGAKGLAHELGHNFGLGHANEYHSANKCRYSMMSQKGDDPRNWLQPTEIKKMHWNLTRTNLMQFVTPESHYGAKWDIKENTNWNKTRRFYNNFEVAKNVTLTISDSIVLPPQAYLKLNRGSKLIFEGKGKITDPYGKEFTNYEKHKSAEIIRSKN